MKFTWKLTLAFVAFGVLVASLSTLMLVRLDSDVRQIYVVQKPGQEAALRTERALANAIEDGFAYLATRNPVERRDFYEEIGAAHLAAEVLAHEVEPHNVEYRALVERIQLGCTRLDEAARTSFAELEKDGQVSSATVAAQNTAGDDVIEAAIELNVRLKTDVDDAAFVHLSNAGKRSILGGLAAVTGALLVGLVLAMHLGRSLSRLTDAAERIRAGDMNARVQGVHGRDELGRLAQTFNAMVDELIARKKEAVNVGAQLRFTEERLARTQRLEGLGRMAGGVAHDFNNLLGVISTNATLITEDTQAPDVGEMLADIVAAAEQGSRLTGQLLAFSGKDRAAAALLDPNVVVEETAHMLRRVLGTAVQLNVSAAARGRIRVNRGQMEQVILNLVINARDAMSSSGVVRVTMRDSTSREHPNAVELSVVDSGSGMSEETRAHLFEPFFTTKGEGKGTGLGLATVYGVVTQARGTIEVDSTLGVGTEFRLYFPTYEAATDSPASPDGTTRVSSVQPTAAAYQDARSSGTG